MIWHKGMTWTHICVIILSERASSRTPEATLVCSKLDMFRFYLQIHSIPFIIHTKFRSYECSALQRVTYRSDLWWHWIKNGDCYRTVELWDFYFDYVLAWTWDKNENSFFFYYQIIHVFTNALMYERWKFNRFCKFQKAL